MVDKLNCEITKIDNNIELFLNIKELLESEKVNINELNDISSITTIDDRIDDLYKKKDILINKLVEEEKILNNYDESLKKIIELKEDKTNNYSWIEIARLSFFCESYCRKVYKKYIGKRDI